MKPIRFALCGALMLSAGLKPVTAAGDSRELVKFPAIMTEHMLANMLDHLRALDEIIGELSAGNADKAATIAEKRLGMSSLERHGAAHLAKFMPEGMKAAGTQLHRAASRFRIAVKNAELAPERESRHEVFKAMQNITSACIACHQGYRVR